MRRLNFLTLAFLFVACDGLQPILQFPHLARCIKRDSGDNVLVPYHIYPNVVFRKENIEFVHNNVFSKAFPHLMFFETTYEKACIVYVPFSACGAAAGCNWGQGLKSFINVNKDFDSFSTDPVFRQTITDFYSKLATFRFDQDIFNGISKFQVFPYDDRSKRISQFTFHVMEHEMMHAFNFAHSTKEDVSILYYKSTGKQFLLSHNDWTSFLRKWGKNFPWFNHIPKQESDWQVVPARTRIETLPFTPTNNTLPELFEDTTKSSTTSSTQSSTTSSTQTSTQSSTQSLSTKRNLQATDQPNWENEFRKLWNLMREIQRLMAGIHPNQKTKKNRKKTFNHHATFDGEGVKVSYVSGSFDEKPIESEVLEKKNVFMNISGKLVEVIEAPVYESMNQVLVLEPQLADDPGSAFIFRQNLVRTGRKPIQQPHFTSRGHLISFN